MALNYGQLHDLVTATLFRDEKKKVSNIDPNLLRKYPAARRLLMKNQVKEQGGKAIRFNVNVEGRDSAEGFGPFFIAGYTVGDHLQQGTMEMKGIRDHFAFDILEEEFNQGEFEIVDHIKNREQQTKISLTKKIESLFWTFQDTTETLLPQGILYYLPYCATEGFVGTMPGSHTDVAGLSTTTYPGWKSYGAPYVAVTQDDLILKMRTASEKTMFEPPLDAMLVKDYNTGNQYGYYAPYSVVQAMENELRNQNDSLGPDVASMDGRAQFRRTPMTTVPALESNARAPVFGINWGMVMNYVKRGWWMKRVMVNSANQPLVVGVNLFCVYQLVCFNRREAGFNIALAA